MTARRAAKKRTSRAPVGQVFLVGAGPGDPGLITMRGLGALRAADVVVYDRLVSMALLELTRPGAERIFAGKAPRKQAMTQEKINALLVRLARAGNTVVRLKGGDPYVFGRGGEEAIACARAGVPCSVIPGVTSAFAAPAAAGIPVTHRGVAQSVAVATAHEAPGAAPVDYTALAAADTAVLLMGVERLANAARALIKAGRDPSTPAAVVERATWPDERVVTAPLRSIASVAVKTGIRAPAVTVVGDVVALREAIGGSEARPLSGRRVLVTRTREQASGLVSVLAELGATPIEAPAIRVSPPRSWAAVDRAAASLPSYDWVVFTSPNGVRFFCSRLRDARAFGSARVAAIGSGTAAVLASFGVRADLIPTTYTTKSVGEAMPKGRGRVLLARADVAEEALEKAIERRGWTVERVVAYRLAPVKRFDPAIRKQVLSGAIDAVTFASGGTVRAFVSLLGRRPPKGMKVACIGPVTAKAAREAGLKVDAVAKEHTIPGLAAAVVRLFTPKRRSRYP